MLYQKSRPTPKGPIMTVCIPVGSRALYIVQECRKKKKDNEETNTFLEGL